MQHDARILKLRRLLMAGEGSPAQVLGVHVGLTFDSNSGSSYMIRVRWSATGDPQTCAAWLERVCAEVFPDRDVLSRVDLLHPDAEVIIAVRPLPDEPIVVAAQGK